MIYLVCPGHRQEAATIVIAALRRSCGYTQVSQISPSKWQLLLHRAQPHVFVVIDPLESWAQLIIRTHQTPNTKLIMFGALAPLLAQHLGAEVGQISPEHTAGAQCKPAPSYGFTESPLRVVYHRSIGDTACPLPCRSFLRYDFTDEWNNLGYGAIRADGSIWAWGQLVQLQPETCIANVMLGDAKISAYAGMWDGPLASLLWFNRSVGPVDSQEWQLIEAFLAHYRYPLLPCCPVLCEVPHGYQAAVTMRLDCDEDVESARPLWEAYQHLGVPFSMALHATVLADKRHHALPREVASQGGAILSHTATHAPDWGGSYEAALQEGANSSAAIESATGLRVRYAVSPFHQTPTYARAALADAGYAGCIAGIIRNDPDFLIARAGIPPGSAEGFIGHSQQCMLHGDCMLAGSDPLKIFKQAFDLARKSKTFFGFLDHPFSPRYQYGWATEAQRIQIHRDFLAYLRSHEAVLFANENDAMDFLSYRAAVQVDGEAGHFHIKAPSNTTHWQLAVEYGGTIHALGPEELLL